MNINKKIKIPKEKVEKYTSTQSEKDIVELFFRMGWHQGYIQGVEDAW